MLCAALVLTVLPPVGRPSPVEPRDVVRAFYEAANAGHVSEARDFYSADAVKRIESALGGREAFASFCSDQTQGRTMTRLDVVDERIDHETARVTLRLRFGNGGLALRTEYLAKADGRWRLAIEPSTP